MFPQTVQQVKRWLKIVSGFTLLAVGVVMLVTPGPGWLTIAYWMFFGLSANGLLNLMHECAHLHVFKERRGSDLLGAIE